MFELILNKFIHDCMKHYGYNPKEMTIPVEMYRRILIESMSKNRYTTIAQDARESDVICMYTFDGYVIIKSDTPYHYYINEGLNLVEEGVICS